MKEKYSVIIPLNLKSKPTEREISAAWILADYFKSDVEIVDRTNQKTADYLIRKTYWELKSSTGTGKHNIQHALQRAARQSQNIVFDARYSKMRIDRIKSELKYQLVLIHGIKKLLLVDKKGKVLVIK